jgi:hypothetical protein
MEFEEREGRLVVRKLIPKDPVDAVYGILPGKCSSDELVAALRGGTPPGVGSSDVEAPSEEPPA